MNYQELLIKNLKDVDKKLYDLVDKDFKYDCVVFVAKGAYLIGSDFATFNNVPLLEVMASRKGGKLKKIISPILKVLPEKLKIFLRKKEVNSNVHSDNSERYVSFNENAWKNCKNCKNILIVDDSVDTGYSMLYVKKAVCDFFVDAVVKVASLNYFDKASEVFKPDYFLYRNTILKGPWSNDSKENSEFLRLYTNWKEEKNI